MQQTIVQVQCAAWDKIYNFDATGHEISIGDYVVVSTQLGLSVAEVLHSEQAPKRPTTAQMDKIIRVADDTDLLRFAQNNGIKKKEALVYCKGLIRKQQLSMKLIDVYFSLDDQRITYAFIANGRVDFRELVKGLAQYLQRSIRLQQIGVRDETQVSSDVGACGQQTCCSRFLKDLGNVNAQFAETQQVSHRGAERLSGVCGRLACCLRYEQGMYEQLSKGMPTIGSKIVLNNGNKGVVRSWHVLKGSINVQLEGDDAGLVEVVISDIRQK